MRYASKVAMCRVQIPKLAYDNNTLEFWYTGNGSATFDPAITTSKSTTIIWQTSDGQTAITTGTSHAFSYTPASGGPYRCTARVAGGLGLVTAIDCNTDSLSCVRNLRKLINASSFRLYTNSSLVFDISEIVNGNAIVSCGGTAVFGDIAMCPKSQSYNFNTCPNLSGSLASVGDSTTYQIYLFSSVGITPGSIAHLTAIRDIRIYSMGWNQAGVDLVIASMWAARAAYTYATPSMQIGGTNAAPSGTYGAPSEGADWHEDTPGHWIPLTGKAMIYDLMNDVNGEGFNVWTITFTA